MNARLERKMGMSEQGSEDRLVFGVALLLEGLLCAFVFSLLQLGQVGSLPLFSLFAAGGFLTVEAEPVTLRLALAVLLGAAVTALWLGLG